MKKDQFVVPVMLVHKNTKTGELEKGCLSVVNTPESFMILKKKISRGSYIHTIKGKFMRKK